MPALPTPTGEIRSPGLLWCEGPNDFAFFRRLVVYAGLTDTVRVEVFEGKENISTYLEILRLRPGFTTVLRSLGIVRDADEDPLAALASVQNSLTANGIVSPAQAGELASAPWFDGQLRTIGVFIAPDSQTRGTLESLYLRSIEDGPIPHCVRAFLQCVSPHLRTQLVAYRAKIEFHTWLAASQQPGILPGHAMDANYIDRDHAAFGPVRAFLEALAAAAQAPDA